MIDVDLIKRFPKPKTEDLIKFYRIKREAEGEDAVTEDDVTSASAEDLGDQNEVSYTVPISCDMVEKRR